MGEFSGSVDIVFGITVYLVGLAEILKKMSDEGGVASLLRAHCTTLEEHAFVSLLIVDLEKGTYKEVVKRGAKHQRVEKFDVSHPEMNEHQKTVFLAIMTKFIERVLTSDINSTELMKRMSDRDGMGNIGKDENDVDEEEDMEEDEDEDDDGEWDYFMTIAEDASVLPYFSQVCNLFQLPEVEINAVDRGWVSGGIIIHLADESKKYGEAGYLGENHMVSISRFHPNFFNVSDKEKLAILFIVRLFGLTVCSSVMLDDDGESVPPGIERMKKDEVFEQKKKQEWEPSWITAFSMSFG